MPLFSEHISNMYYSGVPSYSSSSYGYNSSLVPLGHSYSASYLSSGGNYSSHSSLGTYSRTPLTSRWISGVGRNYSPILGTISERSAGSPVRINSPRRIPISKRSYGNSSYISRPININTADIDVSKDKYRKKPESPVISPPQRKESPRYEKEKDDSPFMPRVDGKPETGIDSSPGLTRSTIKRGRTVVRLHTIRRKERDSPRKPAQSTSNQVATEKKEKPADKEPQDLQNRQQESSSWRERLSEDLIYKDKKAKKTLGTKLAEKHMVKNIDKEESPEKVPENVLQNSKSPQSLPETPIPSTSKSLERRCSMEILAEQANLLDSLIRNENLSTAQLDLSKVGINEPENNINSFGPIKRRKSNDKNNSLKTTKSDHSLHESLKSPHEQDAAKNFSKRRSLKKSLSGGSICRLDSITEFPKEPININLPAIHESNPAVVAVKPKPKLKTKITGSVEVSPPKSPLKFRIEDVVVEEKPRIIKKEITFSSEVDETPTHDSTITEKDNDNGDALIKNESHINKGKVNNIKPELPSPEPEDGNFWNKIGKRETVYLMKRKQLLQEAREKHKRPFFWLPGEASLNEDELEHDNEPLVVDNEVKILNDVKTAGSENSITNESKIKTNDDKIDLTLNVSVINKATEECSQNMNRLENLATKESLQNTLKNDQTKTSLPNDEVDLSKKGNCTIVEGAGVETTVESSSKKQILPKSNDLMVMKDLLKTEIKEESQKEIVKNNEGKQSPQNEVVSKTELTKTPPKLEDISKTNEFKEPAEKEHELVADCSTLETSMVSDENNDNEKSGSEVKKLPGGPKENKNKNNLEEINKEVKSVDMVPKTENITTTLNKTDMQILGLSNQNIIGNVRKVNVQKEMTETEETKKILEASEKEPKMKSNITKIKSSKKKESSKKSTSSKNSAKKDLTRQEKLSKTSVSHDEQEPKESKLKKEGSPKQIDQISPQGKSEATTGSETHKQLETKSSLKGKQLLSPNKNIQISAECHEEPPENHLLEASTSSAKCPIDVNTSISNDIHEKQVVAVPENIPSNESEVKVDIMPMEQKTTTSSNGECDIKKEEQEVKRPTVKPVVKLPEPPTQKKPVKQEAALRPLIATPRPLQKRAPQVIHSSESSDSSSEEESSDEEDDECDASDDSEEFYECEVNPDGRTSTGSNDSGFDSSAPTSPAGFQQIRKGGEVPGTSSNASGNNNSADILEQELEQSTAYGIFRKTGRFTPPARSIPRFRKYTIEDFNFIKVLGKGSFGKVLLAELRDTEYYYAVKCLKKDVVLEDDDVECTLIERKVLALGTNHPYLCHLFATFQTDSHLFFVMEYLNGGDLMFHIQQSGRFPEARARFYAAEIVSGLKFLHKRGIIYRDLKLDNILLDFDGHVRIADFGMCKLQIYLDKTADTFCGTPDYMAPEIIKGLKYNQTVDWWSFGVLLYEMLIGQSPFSGCDEDELFWSICNEMPSYPRFLSQEALSILTRLLDKDARTRLGGTECMHGDIREQAFFHAIHWDRLERRDLEAPFRPRVRHPLDTQYFDRAFTGERPRLTAVEPHVLRSMDQEPFRGFSYTNPNATDR